MQVIIDGVARSNRSFFDISFLTESGIIICSLIFVLFFSLKIFRYFFFSINFNLANYLTAAFTLLSVFLPLFAFCRGYFETDHTLYRNLTLACSFIILFLLIINIQRDRQTKMLALKATRDAELAGNRIEKTVNDAKENERERISRDLHDDVGASLSALKLHLTSAGYVGNIEDQNHSISLVSKIANDIRLITHDLIPQDFSNRDLFTSLESNFDNFNKKGDIKFSLITECNEASLDFKDFAVVNYRIIMELANNIIKHSGATEASIQIAVLPSLTQIIVEDNGTGMTNTGENGIGLRNIYSRVEYLKGKVSIDSSYKGTTIIISIPASTYGHAQ